MTPTFPQQQGTIVCSNYHESSSPSQRSFQECNAFPGHAEDSEDELFDATSDIPTCTTLYNEYFGLSPQQSGHSRRFEPQDIISSPDLTLAIDLAPWDFSLDSFQKPVSPFQNHAELGNNGFITDTATPHPGYHSVVAPESDYWPLATLFTDSSDFDSSDFDSPDVGNLMAPSSEAAPVAHAQHPKAQADQLGSFHCPHPSKYSPGEICGAEFSQRRELDRHSRSVHPRGDDPVYRCRCCYQCARKDNYVRHLKKCTGKGRQFDVYGCLCGYLSATKDDHMGHLRGCRRGRVPNGSGESSDIKRS